MQFLTVILLFIVITAAVIILVFKIFKPREAYTPNFKKLVNDLVKEAAPKLSNKNFDIGDVRAIIGSHADLDATMYYYFKKLLSKNELNEENLTNSILDSI